MSNFSWPVNPSTSGPVQFILDGNTEVVTQDTVTPANSIPLPVTVLDASGVPTDVARESKQDVQIVEAQSTNTKLDTLNATDFATEAKQDLQIIEAASTNTKLDTLNATDFATETTLDALNTKVITADTDNVTVISSALPTGASTLVEQQSQTTILNSLNDRLAGSLVPETFDYNSVSYVSVGNGVGEIETVIYKIGGAAGTTVATLTLAYDSSNRVTSVTRS